MNILKKKRYCTDAASFIGVHDRFTDLGGHSLLAIKLVAAIKKEFDVDIKLTNMLAYPTISELAPYVDHDKG